MRVVLLVGVGGARRGCWAGVTDAGRYGFAPSITGMTGSARGGNGSAMDIMDSGRGWYLLYPRDVEISPASIGRVTFGAT